MMRNSFTYDTFDSKDFGVFISGDAVFNAPTKAYEMIQIPGRSGDLSISQKRMENIVLTYPAFIVEDFAENIQGLRNALLSREGYQRIEDTYHPDEYRIGIYQGGLDVSPVHYLEAGSFDVEFNCKPQRFLKSGEGAVTFTADGSITNPTLFDSKPLIMVNGLGTLGIGDTIITIGGSASVPVYIDCDIMEAYYLSGSAKIPYNSFVTYSTNSFPVLKPGANGIDLGTGIASVAITPRWWRV